MNRTNYFIHLFILCILQILIMNDIHLGPYVYINIYILAIYILPYKLKGVLLLLYGFLLGLFMDLVNNTPGLHAAATTFVAYVRPWLLLLVTNREDLEDGRNLVTSSWFLKYSGLSTLLFYGVLTFVEAFTFSNFHITCLRLVLSTLASWLFILLYYFIALKKVRK